MKNIKLVSSTVSLIFLSSVSLAIAKTVNPCKLPSLKATLTSLISKTNAEPQKYEIAFHSVNIKDCQLPFGATRYMIFKSRYREIVDFLFPFKHTQPFHLIFAPIQIPSMTGYNRNIRSFSQFSMYSSTLFIFLSTTDPTLNERSDINYWFSERTRLYPALKTILFSSANHGTQYTVVCHNYCIEKGPEAVGNGDQFVERVLKNPRLFHRQIFRIAKRPKRITTFLEMRHAEYLYVYKWRSHACLRLIWTSLAYLCGKEVMSTILFETQHNLSLSIIHRQSLSGAQLNRIDWGLMENIFNDINNINYGDILTDFYRWITGIRFSRKLGKQPMYCKVAGNKTNLSAMNFSVWVAPFTTEIWITLILTTFGAFVVVQRERKAVRQHKTQILKMCLDGVGAFLGNSVSVTSTNFKLFIILQFFGMFLCNFYGNGIASILTVPPPPKAYKSIPEVLRLGYKILWMPSEATHPWIMYQEKFRVGGLLHILNDSFYQHSRSDGDKEIVHHLLNKRMLTIDSDFTEYGLIIQNSIRSGFGLKTVECYFLQESLSQFQYLLQMYSVNRDWLFESYAKMLESGLYDKWDLWASRSRRYIWNVSLKNPSPKDNVRRMDQIDVRNVAPILIVMNIVYSLGLVYFIFQYCTARSVTLQDITTALILVSRNVALIMYTRTVLGYYKIKHWLFGKGC